MSALEHHLRLAGEHLSGAAELTAPYGPAREALSFAMRHLGRAEGYLGFGGEMLSPLPACQPPVEFPRPCPCRAENAAPQPFSKP
jgi:hypothetical protein